MLTELATLDKNQQTIRLKEIEKMPIATAHIQRIQALRNTLESAPTRIHSAMVVPRPSVAEDDGFTLSPELLSEKLHDSVKMIKELMSSNRKLKETINELSNIKKIQEGEIAQLHSENQTLTEKIENNETTVLNTTTNESLTILKLEQDKEELLRRIAQLEIEARQTPVIFPIKEKKNEWDWKSKRTIVRAESPGHFIDKDPYQRYQSLRPNTRVRVEKSLDKINHESSLEARVKDDALSALSALYSKTRVKKYGTFV